MAAIFQLRRGTTDVSLTEGELYLHKGSGSIQFGSGSTAFNLLPLNTPAYGDINLIGSISASGDVRIGGNIYLGNESADNISALGVFNTNLVPTGQRDVGTISAPWANIYANRISGSQITGSFSGSVNGIDITEFSTSVDGRLDVIESKYATTGSNNFVGNQTITGSLIVSGSNIQFSGSNIEFTREWPEVGTESHFLRMTPFTSSTGRYYDGLGIGVEHWDDEFGTYEHSLLIHSYDNHDNPNYGAELNVGPYRTHMQLYPSASDASIARVSVQELPNEKTSAKVYADYISIGVTAGQFITIGNTGSLLIISSSNILIDSPLTSSHAIVAPVFSGSISGIGNVAEFSSSISDKFLTISNVTTSFDNRLDRLEESTQSLNDYTQSLKSAIDVTGGNTRIIGDLIVDGTTTLINTSNTYIEDKSITLASGSTTSNIANGAGFNIAGANVTMSWEDSNQRLYFNTNLGIEGSVSSSTIIGLNGASVSTYSTSVDSRLVNLETTSINVSGHITDINAYTQSNDILNSLQTTRIDQLAASTASINLHTESVNISVSNIHEFTASQNDKNVIISNITSSYDAFTGSATASIVELFNTASNHEDRIDNLENKATTLGLYTSSVDDKFTILSNITASYNSHTTSLNLFTSSTYVTFSQSVDDRLDGVEYTASLFGGGLIAQLDQINAATASLQLFTASANSRLDNLELTSQSVNEHIVDINSYTSSNDTLNSLQTTRIDQLASLSGSYATTGSNTFFGTQIVSGSMYVTGDMIIEGSSSIQNISSSTLNIGTNLITVSTNQPSVRFGGIAVIDSGSAGGSGSFLYDSTEDEFIFVHRGNGTNVTSSHFILGPETYDDLGNEIYLTNNTLPKGTGKEHLVDSQISDNGIVVSISNTLNVVGSVTASSFLGTINSTNGVVSGSSQVSYTELSNIPVGIISSSTQIDTLFDIDGLVSGSSQVVSLLPTGVVSGSSQILDGSTIHSGSNGDYQFNSIGIGTTPSNVTGELIATGDIVAFYSSDERLKENINPIQNALEKVESISGNTYDWKEGFETIHSHKGHDLGVIAQEVQSVLPEVVTERETGYLAVDYVKLVPVLIEAIKELSAKIKELENK